MLRDKKGFLFSRLNSCLAFAMCLIMGFAAEAKTYEFATHAGALFQTSKKDQCSIVTIHSLYRGKDGKVLHQQGVGWVLYFEHYYSVLTPFHVVVNAESVFAECKGEFYSLEEPITDAEKDIASLTFTAENSERLKENITPMIYALAPGDENLKKLILGTGTNQNPILQAFAIQFPRLQLKEDMFGIMLGMSNFAVIGPVESETGKQSVLMSPVESAIVQGLVDKKMSYTNNLLRIENMGIRPGQSGSVLVGMPVMPMMTSYDMSDGGKNVMTIPLEIASKVVLGMIVKTRLNGAETVALSIGDIYDFIEGRVARFINFPTTRNLLVNYEQVPEGNRERLQSYMTLDNTSRVAKVYEYCSEEYKNSAESIATENKNLKKLFEQKKLKSKDSSDLKGIQYNQFYKSKKSDAFKDQKSSGGGEYGEGGDGFTARPTQFLTSMSKVGDFKDAELAFRAADNADSFGLYLSQSTCRARGLMVDGKLIHFVKVPGEKPERMTNFEDLRHFHSVHGTSTLDMLEKYGEVSALPFFALEMNDKEVLQVPLATVQTLSSDETDWNPGNKLYLKQKLLVFNDKSNDAIQISKDSLKLAMNLQSFQKLARKGFQDRLQLQYGNKQWKASIAFGLSCRMELEPKYFKQTNPYRVDYDDGKNKLAIDLASQDRFMAISLLKSACPEFKDLALMEMEIYLVRGLHPVIGTRRTALIPEKIDLESLKKEFLLPAGGKK
jgi:hypothetical protein